MPTSCCRHARSSGSDQLTDGKLVGPSAVGVAGAVVGENDKIDVGVGSCGVAGAGADQQQTDDVVTVGGPACNAVDDVLEFGDTFGRDHG